MLPVVKKKRKLMLHPSSKFVYQYFSGKSKCINFSFVSNMTPKVQDGPSVEEVQKRDDAATIIQTGVRRYAFERRVVVHVHLSSDFSFASLADG